MVRASRQGWVATRPQEYTRLPIFPQAPMLSSQAVTWEGIYLEIHCQPAYETPSYRYGWHIVGVHLGQPVTGDVWLENGYTERKTLFDGDVCIFPANAWYREKCYCDNRFIDLHLEPTLLVHMAQDLLGTDTVDLATHYSTRDPLIHQIGLALKTELETTGDRLYAESMTHALAAHLVRRYMATPRSLSLASETLPQHKLHLVLDYIHEHLAQELSVSAIAALAQMSPYHFSRLFKQATGRSPYHYILHRRVEQAQVLLRQGELAIAEVAYAVGFANQSHLTRQCKRILGLTPRQLQKQ
ncbi:MAG: AraC family transcriptional regulator [Oculatellaceae cyanobacterium bins.114]|nr:AraC family transcriptional regulator [Oculatellaceae cyanobacterium bins.114]